MVEETTLQFEEQHGSDYTIYALGHYKNTMKDPVLVLDEALESVMVIERESLEVGDLESGVEAFLNGVDVNQLGLDVYNLEEVLEQIESS
jgi:hypothetical protein